MSSEFPTEPPAIDSGVGITALAVAAARAAESSRPDRLVDDPLAAAFVEAAPTLPLRLLVRWPDPGAEVSRQEALLLLGYNYVGLRTRFFDDVLREAWAAGVRQSVLLAAGLDTRGFRLDWPAGSHLFEIDQPAVLEFKDAVLRGVGAGSRTTRTTVAADLRRDWPNALRANGFDPAASTVWLTEGLLQYLSAVDEERLLARIDELSAPGSRLALERSFTLGREGLRRVREVGGQAGVPMDRLVHTDVRADPNAWLTGHGWTAASHAVDAVAERYGRDLADPRLTRLVAAPAPGPEPASDPVSSGDRVVAPNPEGGGTAGYVTAVKVSRSAGEARSRPGSG